MLTVQLQWLVTNRGSPRDFCFIFRGEIRNPSRIRSILPVCYMIVTGSSYYIVALYNPWVLSLYDELIGRWEYLANVHVQVYISVKGTELLIASHVLMTFKYSGLKKLFLFRFYSSWVTTAPLSCFSPVFGQLLKFLWTAQLPCQIQLNFTT